MQSPCCAHDGDGGYRATSRGHIDAGFTSFIAHAGGLPVNAYLIPLKLKPVVFAATVSYLFFFINLSKWIPYAWLGLLDMCIFATSLDLPRFHGQFRDSGSRLYFALN